MKIIYILFILFTTNATAQVATSSELFKTLKSNDSLLFDVAFNRCDPSPLHLLIREDLEFYHDQGGIQHSKKEFMEVMKKNICGSPDFVSRRELVAGSLKVFPLYDNGTLYGAIQMGSHRFFESRNGAMETPGSTALFTHLWLLNEGHWQLARVLSYDHKAP
ncbi:MAG: nuclear transport factor 2 family protein [Altibacter sp.]|uniref:nuclear transport factor 2 family protein n=1 Tax=Altibacter lentus TaxID=1223410 RepID=UPI0005567018|nr:nuclear transport factor 2 family protein [Altibacter lentus]MCW8981894.1 nuclear transport factor 2 family protein [Altibacter sp.]